MNRRAILAVLSYSAMAIVLSGCASTGGVKTTRFAPERALTIAATAKEVKELVAMYFLQKDYQLRGDSDLQVTFERPSTDFMANVLLSSQYDSTVMTRVVVTLIGDNPTNLSWRGYLVTNPGSAFERLTEITNNADGDNVQVAFRSIKAQAEG